MATRKKKHSAKKNVTHKRYKRHYRKRRFKNNLREYLVSDNNNIITNEEFTLPETGGNMIYGLRNMLAATKNNKQQ